MDDEQYPDENEEFELRYHEEMEMFDDCEPGEDGNFEPIASTQHPVNISEISRNNDQENGIVDSPQLSQISFGTQKSVIGGPVSRRLFGTPQNPQKRGASTPIQSKPHMAPIQEVIDFDEPVAEVPNPVIAQLQSMGLRSKRRLERDLFGDIDDLYEPQTQEDPFVKKARIEEKRDLLDIEKILEYRRRLNETTKCIRKDDLFRLQQLQEFKAMNLSYTEPNYSALMLQRSDNRQVYVRYHSKEYETQQLSHIQVFDSTQSVLGDQKAQVWATANELILQKAQKDSLAQASTEQDTDVMEVVTYSNIEEKLWVDKYKPKKYIELLSDEMTNRSLLFWIKMWDKVVFNREFIKPDRAIAGRSELNSFNKRTGKFESNGGWRNRKQRQFLDTNIDNLGRPIQKVALLCGPPGLGKTTLAHTIARHAGYCVLEINASDDRTPEAFKQALENGTQMKSMLNEDGRPNCIILDEIDGAPRPTIEYLVRFVTDNVLVKGGRIKGDKAKRNILKRPIICICNDVYEPALRPLRQVAFVLSVAQIDSARLAERLVNVARRERLKTDFSSLIALAEKSGNDVRNCISTMQFFNAKSKTMTLQDVLNTNLGAKDRHQGLFDVWGAIFRIQRPRRELFMPQNGGPPEEAQIILTDMSASIRARNVLEVVHAGGDYERLMQGVYENYLNQKMPDSDMLGVVEATQWFSFFDIMNNKINHSQNYALYPYLQFGFVAWHLLFASLAWPKINFPTRGFEYNQRSVTQKNIFQALLKGISSCAVGVGQGNNVLVDTVPFLKRILSPKLRSVAVQLLSSKERYDLKHTVEIMVDLGLTYTQVKSVEGAFQFQLEPNLDMLSQFPGCSSISLPYFGRQLIAREVEMERMRRAMPKMNETTQRRALQISDQSKQPKQQVSPQNLPNHLQRLNPKRLNENANAKTVKDAIMKDFFGRIQQKVTSPSAIQPVKSDPIVKSPIWFCYKEGYNNAVRRDILVRELL